MNEYQSCRVTECKFIWSKQELYEVTRVHSSEDTSMIDYSQSIQSHTVMSYKS